ncbi:MAG: hypothetical protein ACTH1D_12155 [Mycobacteriaceae bacterium]|uniref:hypothetical protein n=1 Tax=Corynebacterium sp. TaxID=1720 RepID=UPI003F9E5ECB
MEQYDPTLRDDMSSYVSATAFNPAERLRRYRPTTMKRVLAWGGIVFGVLMVVGMFTGTGESLLGDILLGAGMGAMALIPSVYWLLCNHRDSRLVTNWISANRDYQQNWEMLAADERALFARPEQLPVIPERKWKTVWVAVVVAFIVAAVGTAFLPEVGAVDA